MTKKTDYRQPGSGYKQAPPNLIHHVLADDEPKPRVEELLQRAAARLSHRADEALPRLRAPRSDKRGSERALPRLPANTRTREEPKTTQDRSARVRRSVAQTGG